MGVMFTYSKGAERPDLAMWLQDRQGDLIDFSTGYSFTFKLAASLGSVALFTKTTGITGAAGAGTDPDGTPNVVIQFTAGELAALTSRGYVWELIATAAGSLDRRYDGVFVLKDVIT